VHDARQRLGTDPAHAGPVPAEALQTSAACSPPAPRFGFTVPLQLVSVAAWVLDIGAITITAIGVEQDGLQIQPTLPVAIACFSVLSQITGGYDVDAVFQPRRALVRLLHAWSATILVLACMYVVWGSSTTVPVPTLAFWFATGSVAIVVQRMALIAAARWLRRAGALDGLAAIVGTGPQAIRLVEHINRSDELAVSLVGFFDDRDISGAAAASLPLRYLGSIPDLIRAIRRGAVTKVYLAMPWSDDCRLDGIVTELARTPVEITLAPDIAGFAYAGRPIASMAGLPVVIVAGQPLSWTQRLQKALEDRMLAAAALIFLAALMLLIAIAIRLDSPGPIFFRQRREGYNCRSFDIFKFRTMHANCGTEPVVQAHRGDRRVTRVGALLRRTSLDELPQLLNVLAGHMSLVGPRPHAPATRAAGVLFGDISVTYAARHRVKPGLTGWAQVCGWRGETTTELQLLRRLEHDLYYVEHWSIWFDLYILARTAFTVLGQRSAY